MKARRKLTEAQKQLIAGQAELDRLKAGGRQLRASRPVFRRLGEIMNEHAGPTRIRSYCVYLTGYLATAAISREHVHELMALQSERKDGFLAPHYAEDFEQTVLFDVLHTQGVTDALEGKPPAAGGFPRELLEA